MDLKSIGLYCISATIASIGVITLNKVAIIVGIIAGVTTIIYNVVKTLKELK